MKVILAAFTAVTLTTHAPIGTQTGGDQTVTLESAAGGPTGLLRVPAVPARPPVVLLVARSATEATAMATALAADGVASLRQDGNMVTTETTAQWIAFLRNDARFPTVSVFGEGAVLQAAVVAARAARADGVITRGDTTRVAADIARVVAKVGAVTDIAGIAAFARSVPVLGRRGAPSAVRPTTARRSPRQTIMTSVGSARVAIEWGAPQMRGREVWGGLVKWDDVWMPGADEATTLTTNGPIAIGSLDLPAGDYTLYTFPTADRLELIVSRDVGQFHTVKDESLFLGRVTMTLTTRLDSVEGLTFAIDASGSAGIHHEAVKLTTPPLHGEAPGGSAVVTVGILKLIWATREYAVSLSSK